MCTCAKERIFHQLNRGKLEEHRKFFLQYVSFHVSFVRFLIIKSARRTWT